MAACDTCSFSQYEHHQIPSRNPQDDAGHRRAQRARLAEVDGWIRHFQDHIQKLEQERNELQNDLSSIVYPVITLPTEIMAEIFLHCLPIDKRVRPCRQSAPLLLTQICRRFRNTSLSTPALWSSIMIDIPAGWRKIYDIRDPACDSGIGGSPRHIDFRDATALSELRILGTLAPSLAQTAATALTSLEISRNIPFSEFAGILQRRTQLRHLYVCVDRAYSGKGLLPLSRTSETLTGLTLPHLRCLGVQFDGPSTLLHVTQFLARSSCSLHQLQATFSLAKVDDAFYKCLNLVPSLSCLTVNLYCHPSDDTLYGILRRVELVPDLLTLKITELGPRSSFAPKVDMVHARRERGRLNDFEMRIVEDTPWSEPYTRGLQQPFEELKEAGLGVRITRVSKADMGNPFPEEKYLLD
ncbi:hypothetical protein DFH09DRAFT_1178350 [Mycena vulgaris]|nr:hypothetical protein DFH09DRAFT_1178350 [Mycena vulgaris]